MKLAVLGALLAIPCVAVVAVADAVPESPRSPELREAGRVRLSHAFSAGAPSGPDADVEFILEERRGDLRKGGASGREVLDSADYSAVAELGVRREILLGPGEPPMLLAPGTYACDLVPGGSGPLRMILRGRDGLRLSLVLAEIPDGDAPVSRATVTAFDQPGDAWVVALRLPTAAGAFVLSPTGEAGQRRSRGEVIRRELRERLMHGARPVRRVPR